MSPKLPRITAADLLRALRQTGWYPARQRGSHLKLQHPVRSGSLVIPVHAGETLKPKTLQGILDQAGISIDGKRSGGGVMGEGGLANEASDAVYRRYGRGEAPAAR